MKKFLVIFIFPIFIFSSFCDEINNEPDSELYSDSETLKRSRHKKSRDHKHRKCRKPFRWWCPLDKTWFRMDFEFCPHCRFPSHAAFWEDEEGEFCDPFCSLKSEIRELKHRIDRLEGLDCNTCDSD